MAHEFFRRTCHITAVVEDTVAAHTVELPITLPMDHTLFELLGEGDARVWLEQTVLEQTTRQP